MSTPLLSSIHLGFIGISPCFVPRKRLNEIFKKIERMKSNRILFSLYLNLNWFYSVKKIIQCLMCVCARNLLKFWSQIARPNDMNSNCVSLNLKICSAKINFPRRIQNKLTRNTFGTWNAWTCIQKKKQKHIKYHGSQFNYILLLFCAIFIAAFVCCLNEPASNDLTVYILTAVPLTTNSFKCLNKFTTTKPSQF